MISIPIWLLVVLIVSNSIVDILLLILIEIICYVHDVIQSDRLYKKYTSHKDDEER